jgi:predicted ribosomally synthesized peptide with SipW-like signal peptide
MKQWSKLAMTAGAIGVLGVAGSAGTFASFTASGAKDTSFSTGNVSIDNHFALPAASNLGTMDPKNANAGYITVTNNGSKPINAYIDFDGPVAKDLTGYPHSTNVLAENIVLDSSYKDFNTPGFNETDFSAGGDLLDNETRMWRVNDRGLTPLYDLSDPAHPALAVLNPGQSKTIYYRVRLLSRDNAQNKEANPASTHGDGPGQDNTMENKSLDERVWVNAVEAGGTDFHRSGADASDNGQFTNN